MSLGSCTHLYRHIMPVKCTSSFKSREGSEDAGLAALIVGHNSHRCLQSLLKECGRQKDVLRGSRLHASFLKRGILQGNISLSNAVISMYAKCGAIMKAQQVFDELRCRDVVSWNALIAGYVQNGYAEEALASLRGMKRDGISPDVVTFLSVLKACGILGIASYGIEIHKEILRMGLLEKRYVLGTALVDMYAKCCSLEKACKVFDALVVHDVVSWNSLIAGFSRGNCAQEVLLCFEQMKYEGLSPDTVTFAFMLKACGSLGAVEKGEEIHSVILRAGLLEVHCSLANALIDMYVKCGLMEKGQQVFDEHRTRDVVSWNVLLRGNCELECTEAVLPSFNRILCEGLCPDEVTFSCILKTCSCKGLVVKGRLIHAQISKNAWLQQNNRLGNALVNMYIKLGAVGEAQRAFDDLPFRDVVSWTTLLTGYAELRHDAEALNCLEQMQCEGYSPDVVTYACILKSCGNIAASDKGGQTHAEIVREGLVGKFCVLDTALVDMYAKCGRLEKAQQVFDELQVRNVVLWTALIGGYAQIRKPDAVFSIFNKMVREGVEPNLITFSVVLNACTYLGLVEQGQSYFEIMSESYGIIPSLGHWSCMINLFAGSGHFDKAMAVIKQLPSSGHLPAWAALLGSCRKWENVKLGRLAFEYAVRFHGKSAMSESVMSSS